MAPSSTLRCELDWVIEQNLSTIQTLDTISAKLCDCLTLEEQRRYPWDLKPSHIAALQRIYAEKGPEIFDGFRRNPLITVNIGVPPHRCKQGFRICTAYGALDGMHKGLPDGVAVVMNDDDE